MYLRQSRHHLRLELVPNYLSSLLCSGRPAAHHEEGRHPDQVTDNQSQDKQPKMARTADKRNEIKIQKF